MTMASKPSCAAASLEANAPSPAATAPTAALFTASRRVTDMRSLLVIVASCCLVSVLSPLWRTSFIGPVCQFIRLRSIRLVFRRDAVATHRRRSGGRAQRRSGIRSDFLSLIDLEPEKAFVVFDPQRRKCFVPVKTKAVECDEKVRPEDRRIDEAAEGSREHYDPEIVSQNSRQVARQNEQDDQECEDVGKGVRDTGRYTFGPVFMISEIDEGRANAEHDQQRP